MDAITALGFVAGTLTTAAFVPQVAKIWQSKSANDISWAMFIIFTTGVALWLVYGIIIVSLPLIITNGITLVLSVLILALKWRYRSN
jgi:MtN3 and saliva related transmembrane protein